jgi:hypothetical protein
VRRIIGDTVEGSGPLPRSANLSDAEIAAAGSLATPYATASRLALSLSAAWASAVATQAGPLRKEWGQASQAWRTLAADFLAQAATAGEDVTTLPALSSGTIEAGQTEPPNMAGYGADYVRPS